METKKQYEGGCDTCKHYRMGRINVWTEDTPRSCTQGLDESMNYWWAKNREVKAGQPTSTLACYEPTHEQIKFERLIETLRNIKKELKNMNDGK